MFKSDTYINDNESILSLKIARKFSGYENIYLVPCGIDIESGCYVISQDKKSEDIVGYLPAYATETLNSSTFFDKYFADNLYPDLNLERSNFINSSFEVENINILCFNLLPIYVKNLDSSKDLVRLSFNYISKDLFYKKMLSFNKQSDTLDVDFLFFSTPLDICKVLETFC